MHVNKHVVRGIGIAALAAAALGFAAPAQATAVPPTASTALSGTWVNVNSASRSVKQVVIAPTRSGTVTVDAFGSCSPTLCEWGRVPAIVYGSNVSSKTGAIFQTRQRFLSGTTEWSRTTLLGRVVRTSSGLRLTLRELTVFEDGSSRRNYTVTETFARGRNRATRLIGHSVLGYPHGQPPALLSGAFGTWKNVSSTGALVKITVSGTTANPVITAYGRCTPTPCQWGSTKGITYGPSIGSTRGGVVLAPYLFGFKKTQLVIRYGVTAKKVPVLSVAEYNEFTDHSGRSNYAMTETFVRA